MSLRLLVCDEMGREEQIIKERERKIGELRKDGINPYAHKFDKTHNSSDLQKKYKKLKPDAQTKDSVKTAGRVMIKRDMGKLAFVTVQDGYGKIQILLRKGDTPDGVMKLLRKVDSGDFIGVEGTIIKTQRGEVSVLVKKWKF